MSSNPTAIGPAGIEPSAASDAWYLVRKELRFGPFTEDEMRKCFRAGMVKPGDTVAVAGQSESVPAELAATLLGIEAPMAASAVASPAKPASTGRAHAQGGSWLIRIGGVVAIIGMFYFVSHEPLKPRPKTAQVTFAPTASPRPMTGMGPPAEAPVQEVASPVLPQSQVASPVVEPSATIAAATLSAAAEAGDRARSAVADEWYERATILALAEDWNGMLAHAGAWTVSQPSRDLAWWYLGWANWQLGSLAEAEAAFKQALVISPGHFNARWSLANVYLRTNRSPEARVIMLELVREQPGNAALWNDLGVAMDNSGEFDEAVAAYEKSVQLKPDYQLAWVNLSKCYAHFGYKDRSKAAAVKASSL